MTGEALSQREDDKPESVKKRLIQYEERTRPLIDYFEEQQQAKSADIAVRRFYGTGINLKK